MWQGKGIRYNKVISDTNCCHEAIKYSGNGESQSRFYCHNCSIKLLAHNIDGPRVPTGSNGLVIIDKTFHLVEQPTSECV